MASLSESPVKLANSEVWLLLKQIILFWVIKTTFTNRDGTVIAKLNKSLLRLHLNDAVQACDLYLKQAIETFERVLPEATNFFSEMGTPSHEERPKKFNVSSLKTRGSRSGLIEVFKTIQGTDDL